MTNNIPTHIKDLPLFFYNRGDISWGLCSDCRAINALGRYHYARNIFIELKLISAYGYLGFCLT